MKYKDPCSTQPNEVEGLLNALNRYKKQNQALEEKTILRAQKVPTAAREDWEFEPSAIWKEPETLVHHAQKETEGEECRARIQEWRDLKAENKSEFEIWPEMTITGYPSEQDLKEGNDQTAAAGERRHKVKEVRRDQETDRSHDEIRRWREGQGHRESERRG
jgi:hypothetical protein